jgi:AcrR family transcriptional regulator
VPAGTTSFYFRTRKALLQGVAERLTELDVADLSRLGELAADGATEFQGTAGLARMVMYSATEPWLTRSKARYDLVLEASRDAELSEALQRSVDVFYGLARDVVAQWHSGPAEPDPQLIDDQALAAFTYINGVMMSFVSGRPVVEDADHLHRLIDGVVDGVTRMRPGRPHIAY